MLNLEPFLRDVDQAVAFSDALQIRVAQAIANPLPAERPEFDTFGLTPLGFAISEELARVVSTSKRSFRGFRPEANKRVIQWLARGNAYFQGNYSEKFIGTVVDPVRESVTPVEAEAITIARYCIANGSGPVMDANLAIRSILGIPEMANEDGDTKVKVLGGSHGLVSRLARLNDTDITIPGRREFEEAVGIVHPFTGIISPEYLVYDETTHSADFTRDAKKIIKACGGGPGCVALRMQVEHQGQTLPLIEAFWGGAVDVTAHHLAA